MYIRKLTIVILNDGGIKGDCIIFTYFYIFQTLKLFYNHKYILYIYMEREREMKAVRLVI